MAGHVRKLENGRWIARFPVGGRGRFRSQTFDRKRDAESWLTSHTTRRDRGEWIDPTLAGESFGSVAAAWERSRRNVAASTAARDSSYLKTLILPALGHYELRHLTVDTLNDWIADLEQEKAPATVRKAFQLAAAVLDSAVISRKLATNPARIPKAIELPALPHEEMRFLSAEEVYLLADAIDPRYRALVLTAAFTGLRWGELVGLKAKHLNLETGRLSVVETLSEVGGHTAFKSPKTAASKRTVSLPAELVGVLREHLLDRPAVGNGLVFSAPGGSPILRSNFRQRVWELATESAGVAPLRFHDLRHSHASMLIAQGEHVKVIQSRLGHSSISVTMDRYGHLLEGLDTGTAARLDGIMKHSGSTGRIREPASIGVGNPRKP